MSLSRKILLRIILINTFLCSFTGNAAPVFNSPADSFRHMLRTAKHDTTRTVAMLKLSWELHHNDLDTALVLTTMALNLARETGELYYIAWAENTHGLYNFYKGNFQASIDYLTRSLKKNQELGKQKQIANNYLNLGLVYERMGSQSLALDHYLKALRIREELKDSVGIAWCYNNIGAIHFNMRNYDLSLINYVKALKMFEKVHFNDGIGWVNNNIGSVYLARGVPDSSIFHFERGLDIYRDLGRKANIAECYNFLADAYLAKREFGKAEEFIRSSLELATEVGATQTIASCHSLFGLYYFTRKDYVRSVESYREAMRIAVNTGNVEIQRTVYQNIAESFRFLNMNDSAYLYSKKFIQIQDSIFSDRALRQINEMSALYETEKKQREIEILQLNSNKQRLVNIGLAVGALLMLIVIGLGVRSFRQKNRSNRILQEQNEIIATKNKHITDSINYSKRIQESILPLDEEMRRIFPEHFVINFPKDIVSGDFYWVAEKGDKKIICVADCTGHGVPGALMSMLGNNLLNQIVMERDITYPSDILQWLDMGITAALKQTDAGLSQYDGIDAALCVFEEDGNKIRFAGAVRPLILFRNGKMEEYRSGKFSVGGKPGHLKQFPTVTIENTKGVEVFLFSDGYADQFGGDKGKKMMVRNFKELLQKIQNNSIPQQKEVLITSFNTWRRDFEQVDDILVVGLRL